MPRTSTGTGCSLEEVNPQYIKKTHAPVTGNGVEMMVGSPRPGYLRRRRTVCSLAFTATEYECESTETEKGGGRGLGDLFRWPLPSLGGFEYLEASYPQIQGAQ